MQMLLWTKIRILLVYR